MTLSERWRRRQRIKDPWGRRISIGSVLDAARIVHEARIEACRRFIADALAHPESEWHREVALGALREAEAIGEWYVRVIANPRAYWQMPIRGKEAAR